MICMFLTFEAMIGCSEQTEGLVQIIFVVAPLVLSSKLDAAPVKVANHASRGCNATVFRGNVCFETSSFIDSKLPTLVDRCAEARVILSGVNVVGVIFGVVDVLLGTAFLLAWYMLGGVQTHTGSSRVSLS